MYYMIDQEYISTEELAKIYNIHEETARRWCKNGTVEAKKVGRKWYIKRDKENIDE